MFLVILLLIIGLVLLVKFSDITVKSAVKLSKLADINEMTIGFVLIAVSTSIPELSIAITSSLSGQGIISFGNIIGSNVSNLALIFGIISIAGFTIAKKDFPEIVDAIIITSLIPIFILCLGIIDAVFGIFCLITFILFSRLVMKRGIAVKEHEEGLKTLKIVKSTVFVIVSVLFVWLGAKLVIDSVMIIAQYLSIAEQSISAIILGIGTTLPELSVAIMALKNKNISLAIGDGIGSVVTNLTLVLGVATLISPITIDNTSRLLLFSLILVNVLFLFLARRLKFSKKEGAILLSAYIIFLIAVVSGMFL
jgi:cation:H+ antiporter